MAHTPRKLRRASGRVRLVESGDIVPSRSAEGIEAEVAGRAMLGAQTAKTCRRTGGY